MLVIPAIDLLGGRCVRLHQGDYAQVETYANDPVETARAFVRAGAQRIHIVDLDAAKNGLGVNRAIIGQVRRAVDAVLEVGGGIRTDRDVEELLAQGVDRLVVGTLLVRQPELFESWAQRFGAHFIAGIDALDGEVKVSGWEQGSSLSDLELARRCRDLGAVSLIYTNIARDGTLGGPDVERTLAVAEAAGLPVILSGGVASLDDVARLAAQNHPLLAGVITGKALYRGKLDLAEAVARHQKSYGGVW
ncbi:MAG: 1-(5-phosphoribosyl)-5-[(5-phosphoribosylamino)methylideneamino]imidazole-4-carboxamide isomerase [Spirochaetales bacterium]|nr:1-(5-phosphoribosyl)-5-[(5-phosphoribosylamino)methylideneamino]imidazole-4-carboxamide isomerase [Spirochaetales bacterium]